MLVEWTVDMDEQGIPSGDAPDIVYVHRDRSHAVNIDFAVTTPYHVYSGAKRHYI